LQAVLAVLADYAATTDDGKLLIAGVFETINTPALPAVHPMMALALRIAAAPGEAGNHRLTLKLVDPAGEEVIPALDGEISLGEMHPVEGGRAQIILNMPGVKFASAGKHRIDVILDGQLKHSLDLFVRLIPAAEDSGPSRHFH